MGADMEADMREGIVSPTRGGGMHTGAGPGLRRQTEGEPLDDSSDPLDPLISRVYARVRERLPRFSLARSGLMTTSFLVLALVVFGLFWQAHRRAQFHRLRTPVVLQTAPAMMPGGQEAITLSRAALWKGTAPEYVSATVLPGIGMQVLQVTIAVPDHGTRALLQAPTVAELVATPDATLESGAFHLRVLPRRDAAKDGERDLLGNRPASGVQNLTMPDGGRADGVFSGSPTTSGDPNIDAYVSSTLVGRTFDVTVRAINRGQENRVVALDWSPRFQAPGGDLSRLVLALPSKQRLDGKALRSVIGTQEDFSADRGTRLRREPVDVTYVGLRRDFLGEGPVTRLVYLDDGITLRITALTPSIRSIRVHAAPVAQALTLSFSTADASATGVDSDEQVLRVGATLQWHLRMEVLATTQSGDGTAETRPSVLP